MRPRRAPSAFAVTLGLSFGGQGQNPSTRTTGSSNRWSPSGSVRLLHYECSCYDDAAIPALLQEIRAEDSLPWAEGPAAPASRLLTWVWGACLGCWR